MILDRYLVREILGPFAGVSTVLLVIFVTYSLTRFLTDASSGLLNVEEVAYLTALKGLIALEVLLPIGLYVAIILGLGRMYSDSEIDAIRGSGISQERLLRPVMTIAFGLAFLIAILTALGRPWAYAQTYALEAVAEASSDVDRIKAGRFHTYDDDEQTVFIESMASDGVGLQGVFVSRRESDGLQVISAESGKFYADAAPGKHELVLINARVFKSTDDTPNFLGQFQSFRIWLNTRQPESVGYKPKAEPTLSLRSSSDFEGQAEYQWRLSTPLSTLLLALLAVPLSRSKPRQGRFAKLLLGFVVYAAYYNLLGVGRTWVEQGVFGHIWWAPAGLGLLVIYLYVPWWQWFGARGRANAA